MRLRRPWTWLAIAGALALIPLRLTWSSLTAMLPRCSIRELSGLYCPGCGGTRCATRLLKGDLSGAFVMNPLLVVLGFIAAGVLAMAVAREWQKPPKGLPQIPSWFAWSLTGLILVFGLVRNLPWWPFTLLVPH